MIKAQQILESISKVLRLDERNMYDTEGVDYWIKEKFYVVDEPIQKWLETRLRKYVINDFPDVKVIDHSFTSPVRRLPDWVEQAIQNGEEVVYFDAGTREVRELKDQISHVIDYFEYMLANYNEIDPRLRVRNLLDISVPDAIRKSEEWTRWMNKREFGNEEGGYEEVLRVGNYKWLRLLSTAQLNYEGKEMQHCVGSYAHNVSSRSCEIFSLRDSNDEPHVTIEYRPSSDEVNQIKGKQNKAPIEKYWDATIQFLQFGAKKGWFKKFKELENVGAVLHNGEVYPEDEAPEEYQLTKGLADAVKRRDKNRVLELLKRGASVDAIVSDQDETILMVASVWYGNTEIIDIILDGHPNLEAEDDNGNTAIFYANDADVAEKLRKAGANLHHKNKRGNTAFTNLSPVLSSVYSSSIDEDLLKFFLRHGFDIDEKDGSGNTLLYNTLSRNSIETANILVKYGADVDFVGNNGETLLQKNSSLVMSSEGSPPVLEFLVTRGADPNTPIEYDGTILIARLTRGDHFTAHLLLDRGADPNVVDTYNRTPLYHAISKCGRGIGMGGEQAVVDIVEHLIKRGADVNKKSSTSPDYSPLRVCFECGYATVAEILLKNGANPFLDWTSPYAAALGTGKKAEEFVRLLLDYEVDLTVKDQEGWSGLDYIEYHGTEKMKDMARSSTEENR
jgi:ankyrin repeat protein